MDQQEYEEKFLKKFKEENLIDGFRRASIIPTYEKTSQCPICGAKTNMDIEQGELYCNDCGLIVKGSIAYVGVFRIEYPFGTLL